MLGLALPLPPVQMRQKPWSNEDWAWRPFELTYNFWLLYLDILWKLGNKNKFHWFGDFFFFLKGFSLFRKTGWLFLGLSRGRDLLSCEILFLLGGDELGVDVRGRTTSKFAALSRRTSSVEVGRRWNGKGWPWLIATSRTSEELCRFVP